MKIFEAIVLAAVAWLVWASIGWSQNGPNNQGPQTWQPWAAARGEYQWQQVPGQPEYAALYQGNQQIGVYNWETGFYQQRHAGGWSGPARAPIAPPFARAGNGASHNLFGLQMPRLPAGEKIWCGTTTFSHAEAAEMLEADLRDDAKSPHLTVIDRNPARRKQLVEDLTVAKWKGELPEKARVQVYNPDLAPVKALLAPFRLEADREFQKTGCMVIAQAAATNTKGTSRPVRLYGAASPPVLVDALRSVDPSYDPNRNPLPWWLALPSIPLEAIVVIGLLLLILGVAIGRKSS